MTFSSMMARLNKPNATEEIIGKVKNNYPVDPRFWQPTQDKKGEGSAIVRFLPAPEGETDDFAKFFTHYITGTGKKYVERCRTTINEADPAQEMASRLGSNDKNVYAKYGRNARFIANIVVLNDPGKPDNNGKVFLYEFGNKIMTKLTKAMKGSEDPLDPIAPVKVIHPLEGANFKVVVSKQGGNNNYDDSKFLAPSALFNGDIAKIEALWKTAYPLKPLTDPSTFKSYDELFKLLVSVVGDLAFDNSKEENAETETSKVAAPKNGAVATGKPAEDPDKVFDDLLNGTPAVSTDAAVDAMFADDGA